MRRAERKLQLSQNVVGDYVMDQEGRETAGVDMGDFRSIVFGLHMFVPTENDNEESNEPNPSKFKAMAERVIALRHEQRSDEDDMKFEVNPIGLAGGLDVRRSSDYVSVDPGLDEESYNSWLPRY